MKIKSLHPHGDLKQIVQTYPNTEQEMHNLMTNWHPTCHRIVILELFALLHLLVGKLGDHDFTGSSVGLLPVGVHPQLDSRVLLR